ncbi:tRNA (adenosine(37)-N6)-threonylcarbamoyltransferase complex transferase subunit TsaD [Spiroplasma endosymbiont of Anurida maritima]|uniref:tRNA (adenosine(37)-N6)-threonylcarbamoyltransferase complex transferase subunit TsaD n=1 Tax=Spiroplasma endosymbiont of Anurida maritima TaxID=2967972 RepID=UPI0036D37771
MIILAIETSCDETSFSILKDGKVLSNVISSQIEQHTKYGGVIPELASRMHFENFDTVLEEAINTSKISLEDINYIAYTANPGLLGALHVGKIIAKTLSDVLNIPLIPLNHLHGHIYAGKIDNNIVFPAIALLISGGHTQLIYLKENLNFEIIGTTKDDAIGECFDKVARELKLSYPGGPIIEKKASLGKVGDYDLPFPLNDDSLDFSFSGLKSAAIRIIRNHEKHNLEINTKNFCADFQEKCTEILYSKLTKAIKKYQVKSLILAGGVAANKSIRNMFVKLASQHHLQGIIPKLEYCTDNAAMIAMLAYETVVNK